MTVTLDATIALETVPGPHRLFRVTRRFNFSVDGVPGFLEVDFYTDLASQPLDIDTAEPYIARPAAVHDAYCQHGAE